MRIIFTMLCLAFITPANLYSDEPDKTLHNKCLYPTVIVKSNEGYGSGVILRSEKIEENRYQNVAITCAHCLPSPQYRYKIGVGEYKNWSHFVKWNFYPAFVFCRSQMDKDLAILIFESDKALPVAEINFNPKIYIGSKILRVGCGMGDEQRIDFGRITSLNGAIPNLFKNNYRTSVYSVPGDSGGPVYHDNKVIGIVQALRSRRSSPISTDLIYGISYAIPMKRLKTLSEEINKSADFVFDHKERMPVIPFFHLKMNNTEINNEIMPSSRWSKGF